MSYLEYDLLCYYKSSMIDAINLLNRRYLITQLATKQSAPVHKVTISLPEPLLEFADQRAAAAQTSRSQIIGEALTLTKTQEEQRLAAEGYQFYAPEAAEFAQAASPARQGRHWRR
jgi:hypothetical protein